MCGYIMLMVQSPNMYMDSVVNAYLTNVRMAEERGRAGAKALSDWLRRCRATVRELKKATLVSLYPCKAVRIVSGFSVIVWG